MKTFRVVTDLHGYDGCYSAYLIKAKHFTYEDGYVMFWWDLDMYSLVAMLFMPYEVVEVEDETNT